MQMIFGIFLGAMAGFLLFSLLTSSKLSQIEQINLENIQKNQEVKESLAVNQRDLILLEKQKNEINSQIQKANLELINTDKVLNNFKIETEKKYCDITQNVQTAMDRELEKICLEFQKAKEDCNKEYQKAIADYNVDMAEKMAKKEEEYKELVLQIKEARKISNAAIEANKRVAEMEEKKNFYKLNLSDEDKEEIKKLRTILPQLRNAEPLNKIIWKVYYENPYSDLVGRVVGSGIHSGIYKITNLENGMCYVGQSVNIAERFKQHIKRGIGAEAPTRNKLYPAMLAIGVENFSFEIIEECEKNLLNEREDYWQDFFKAKEFGYSIK